MKTKALADSFRSDLVTAANKGEPFDTATGRPVSALRANNVMSWFDLAKAYAEIKWPDASPKQRRSIAEALTNITVAMLVTSRSKPDDKSLRKACATAFNLNLRGSIANDNNVQTARQWLERNTRPVADLAQPDMVRLVLNAIGSKLDGGKAATNTTLRKRMILRNTLDYAIEKGLLNSNPLVDVKVTKKTKSPALRQVDKRSVVNPVQARTLLGAVRTQRPSGPRLVAFFGAMYYAALRPEEAAALCKEHLSLPPAELDEETGEWEFPQGVDGWGEIHLERTRPEVAAEWTDSNSASEERGLKHRDPSEGRTVPCPPPLTTLLHTHLGEFGTAPDGRLFWGVRKGGRVPSSVYGRVWAKARAEVFTEEIAASPLGKRPYDLRHAAVSTWLKAGIEVTRVAEWAGHSVAVLLRVYAKFIDGGEQSARARVEEALRG